MPFMTKDLSKNIMKRSRLRKKYFKNNTEDWMSESWLLIAKLNTYGFILPALRLIYDYLLNRKQRVRINNSYGTWMEIVL